MAAMTAWGDEDPAVVASGAGGDHFDFIDSERREAHGGRSEKGRGPE